MSRFDNYQNPRTPMDMAYASEIRHNQFVGVLTPDYLSEGRPSFSPPSSNFFTNLLDKAAENSIMLGDGWGYSLNSGFGLFARGLNTLGDAELPTRTAEDHAIFPDGSVKHVGSLQGAEYFDTLEPEYRVIFEQNGVTRNQFDDVENVQEATVRFREIARQIELRQSIVAYNEVNPNWATATGIVGFIAEAATDPLTLATLGAGAGVGIVKSGATQATRIGVQTLVKEAAEDAIFKGVRASLKNTTVSLASRRVRILPKIIEEAEQSSRLFAHGLSTVRGGSLGVAYDYAAQIAEYHHRVDALGIQEQFNYSYGRGGFGFLMVAGLDNLGAALRGSKPKPITNRDVISRAPTSAVANRLRNKARKGIIQEDAHANLHELTIIDRIEKWARFAYDDETAATIIKAIEEDWIFFAPGKLGVKRAGVKATDNINMVLSGEDLANTLNQIGEFFAKAPTQEEALYAVRTGDFNIEPAMARIKKRRDILQNEVDTLVAKRELTAADRSKILRLRNRIKKLDHEQSIYVRGGRINKNLTVKRGYLFTQDDPNAAKMQSLTQEGRLTDVHGDKDKRLIRTAQLVGLDPETAPAKAPVQTKQLTNTVFNFLSKLGSLGTLARSSDKLKKISNNPIAQSIAKMYAAMDARIANDFFQNADGSSIITLTENMVRLRIMRGRLQAAARPILKGLSKEEQDRLTAIAIQVRTGVRSADEASNDAVRLAKEIGKYYDSVGDMGLRNGAVKNRIDGYVNVVLKKGFDESSTKYRRAVSLLASYWKKTFDPRRNDGDAPLHNATLNRMKLMDDTGKFTHSGYDEVPTRFLELTDEHQARYLDELDAGLQEEARHAFSRRMNRDRAFSQDPSRAADERRVVFREDNRASRQIEQEFWYSDEVLELGILDTNLDSLTRSYEDGFGGLIAQQETMSEVFGEAVRFTDYVEVVRREIGNLPDSDPAKEILQRALTDLEELNDRTLNRIDYNRTGTERLFGPLVDLAAASIQSGIVIAMQTEVATILPRALFNKHDIRLMMRHFKETFKSEQIRQDLSLIGQVHEYDKSSSRLLGDSLIDPTGSLGNGLRKYREFTREYFGEAALTRRLKRFHHQVSFAKTARKLRKVADRLHHLEGDIDTDGISAAARNAGFGSDVGLAIEYKRIGLHTARSRKALARYREFGEDVLQDMETATKVAMQESDDDLRDAMLELIDNINRYARQDTDNFVVTRSGGTMLRSNDVLGNAIYQFLTYPSSWFNGFLRSASNRSNHYLLGYLGTYLMGEIYAGMLRDVAFGKNSIDDVVEDWEENFFEKATVLTSRIPVGGVLTDLVTAPIISAATGRRFRLGLSSNPSVSFIERAGQEAFGTMKKVANGEDVSPRDFKNAMRVLVPGGGFPVVQSLIRDYEEE